MTNLGAEWVPDEDGIPSRRAARLLIFDEAGNVLLVRGHDTHDLNHRWWFSVGGGLADGEDPAEGAAREAWEETGFVFDPKTFEGPVVLRRAQFEFKNVVARQDEQFFIVRIPGFKPELKDQELTEDETQTLDEFRWFSPSELHLVAARETVYPAELPSLVEDWSRTWDGIVAVLTPPGTWTSESWTVRSKGAEQEPQDGAMARPNYRPPGPQAQAR